MAGENALYSSTLNIETELVNEISCLRNEISGVHSSLRQTRLVVVDLSNLVNLVLRNQTAWTGASTAITYSSEENPKK